MEIEIVSDKLLVIPDEVLDKMPTLRSFLARKIWKAYWRNLRIEKRELREKCLNGNITSYPFAAKIKTHLNGD